MLFNSVGFLVFFAAVLAVDQFLQPHARRRKAFMERMRAACREAGAEFVDLFLPRYRGHENFHDLNHMQPGAAAELSREIARDWLLPRLR